MLRYDFLSYSEGSRRLIDFGEADSEHPGIDAPDGFRLLIGECRRTGAELAAAAPGRIQRGALTRAEADRQVALFAAIAADLEAERDHHARCRAHFQAGGGFADMPLVPDYASLSPFSWEDKLHALRREIHLRRSHDAERIARGRTTAALAREQLERLEAVQDKYWRQLFAWTGTSPIGTPEWRAEIRAHGEKIEEAGSPAKAGAQAARAAAVTI